MKKSSLLGLIIVVGLLFVPAVSAYEETFYEPAETKSEWGAYDAGIVMTLERELDLLRATNIESLDGLKHVMYVLPGLGRGLSSQTVGRSTPITVKKGSTTIAEGTIGFNINHYSNGTVQNTIYYIEFDYFNPSGYVGTVMLTPTYDTSIVPQPYLEYARKKTTTLTDSSPGYSNCNIEFYSSRLENYQNAYVRYSYYVETESWSNTVKVSGELPNINVKVIKNGCWSGTSILDTWSDIVLYSGSGSSDENINLLSFDFNVTIVSPKLNNYYITYPIPESPTEPTQPDSYPVRVDVESAATGAKISNAQLGVREYENTTWIRNETLTYGWTQFYLPPGNYEFFAVAPGYTQPSPGRLTVDGVDDNIVLLLYPVTPPPSAGNVTLQVWANYGVTGSGQRYAVPGAQISVLGLSGEGAGFDSGILTANDQGLVVIDVPGNSTYSAYASKTGYTAGETEFSVTTVSPVHVSVELTPTGGLPTYPVTVYAQSSATGALVNNANLGIRLYGNENWLHNETLTYGWTQVLLPEGNYEFFVDATGYTQPSPGRLTVDGVDDNIVLLLYPVTPPPEAGNVTLKIWANYGVAGSGQRYAVPGAQISVLGLSGEGAGFDSGILTANDQGMVILEVPGNTSYSAYGSKTGYTSGETEFIVTTVSPVHVSVALEKLALPTEPPVTPSVPPTTPTPAETPGEGFISQVANAFAVFLGVPYTTGKTALGMVIASAVGFTTAKQLRGGAPEFGVGLLAGAGLATLIGLLPVWLFVVLILVVGMLIGYKYMQGGQ